MWFLARYGALILSMMRDFGRFRESQRQYGQIVGGEDDTEGRDRRGFSDKRYFAVQSVDSLRIDPNRGGTWLGIFAHPAATN